MTELWVSNHTLGSNLREFHKLHKELAMNYQRIEQPMQELKAQVVAEESDITIRSSLEELNKKITKEY